jgi:hypothetical protein
MEFLRTSGWKSSLYKLFYEQFFKNLKPILCMFQVINMYEHQMVCQNVLQNSHQKVSQVVKLASPPGPPVPEGSLVGK